MFLFQLRHYPAQCHTTKTQEVLNKHILQRANRTRLASDSPSARRLKQIRQWFESSQATEAEKERVFANLTKKCKLV